MNTRPARLRRRRQRVDAERGSVTLFLAITTLGLLILTGLVVDGGAKLRATQHADQVAAEAARAAGQALDLPAAITGTTTPSVNTTAAVAAAHTHLAAAGLPGDVTVDPTGTRLTVSTADSEPTVFLGLIGIHTLAVTGTATVTLVHGISGAGP